MILVVLFSLGSSFVSSQELTVYHCDEGSGNVLGDSIGIYGGTWSGTSQWEGTITQGGYSIGPFSGSNYIVLPTSLLSNKEQGKISFWVYLTSWGDPVIAARIPISWHEESGNYGYIAISSSTEIGSVSFNLNLDAIYTDLGVVGLNQWHHIEVTWGDSRRKIYVDDNLEADVESNSTFPQLSNLVVGKYVALSGYQVYGYLDEIVISNSSAELTCSDGTPYGQCSSTKPLYCDNGNLVDNCQVCGCEEGYECQPDGECTIKDILFYDDFNDGNDYGWNVIDGNWSVIDDWYSGDGNTAIGGDGRSIVERNWSNYTISGKFKVVEPQEATILLRVRNASPGKNMGHYYQFSTYSTNDKVWIQRISNGNNPITSADYDFTLGETYFFRVDVNGTKATLFINNEKVLEYDGLIYDEGGFGLKAYNSVVDFDDILVSSKPLSTDFYRFNIDSRSGSIEHGGVGIFDTGVFVNPGNLVQITATDGFYNGVIYITSPDGLNTTPDPAFGSTILPNISSNSLVGAMGSFESDSLLDDGSDVHPITGKSGTSLGFPGLYGPGYIGSLFSAVIPEGVSGNIILAINDRPLQDNVGSLNVTIKVTHSYTPSCSDGTPYYSCSSTKPLYCDNGNLIDNCQVCGCEVNYVCQEDGGCVLSNITIYIKNESGNSIFNASVLVLFSPDNYSVHSLFAYTDTNGKVSFNIPQGSDMSLYIAAKGYWDEVRTYYNINKYIFHLPIMQSATTDIHVTNIELIKQLSYSDNFPDFKKMIPQTEEELIISFATKYISAWALDQWKNAQIYGEPALWTTITTSTKGLAMWLVQAIASTPKIAAAKGAAIVQTLPSRMVTIPFFIPTFLIPDCMYTVEGCLPFVSYASYGNGYVTLSSVDILVIDSEGRRTGALYINDTYIANITEIPSSKYSGHGSHPNSVYIPSNISIESIELIPYELGEYIFQISTYQNDTLIFYQEGGNFVNLTHKNVSSGTLKKFENPPIADGGSDQTVLVGTNVNLNASNSYDINGSIISYEWVDEDNITISTDISFSKVFPKGINTIKLYVIDNDNITSVDNINIIVEPFKIDLSPGWNIVSSPLLIDDKNLSILFDSIRLINKGVLIYNSSNNKWYKFDPNNLSISNLRRISSSQGFWINAEFGDVLEIDANKSTNISIELNEGWNLIAYPYLYEMDITDSELSDYPIFTYNGSWSSYVPNRTFNSLTTLKPGYGYWVKK